MARRFTASEGVHLFGLGVHFKRDRSADTPEGAKGYSAVVDDDDVADKVAAIDAHGITEVDADVPAPDDADPEPDDDDASDDADD